MSNRPVFWGRSGAIPVTVQNGSTTGFSPEERKAYAAGWDAAKAEDAKIIQALADELSGLAKTLAPTKGEDER